MKPDDVLICMIDEWGKGEKEAFDCRITSIRKDGVDVCYLSGYRSRNDFVPWADVVARVGSYSLWGDVPLLMRQVPRGKMAKSGMRPELRAEIPDELARSVAEWFEAGLGFRLANENCPHAGEKGKANE